MLNYLPFSRGLNPDQRGIFITLLFLAFFSFPALVQAQETPFVDGDLIVMLVKGEEPQKVLAKFSEVNGFPTGITHRQELSGLSNIHLFHIDFTSVDQQMVLERIQNQSWVLAAQFNHYVDDRATPNDPSFGTQWHHVDGTCQVMVSGGSWQGIWEAKL
jgi:hypothetical protein